METNIIHHGDCLNIMRDEIASESIDLTVTSPPYDELRDYEGFSFDFEGIARELFRITKPGGVLVWVVADQTTEANESATSFRQALFFKDACGFNLLDTMIYRKANPGGARGTNLGYWQCFEYMFVFSKGKPKTFNPLEDRRNVVNGRRKGGGRRNKDGSLTPTRTIDTNEFGRRLNMWEYATGHQPTDHPAPFPEALAQDHILSWSNPGDLVFDPFTGSGTTPKMAYQNNRRYLGCETSKNFWTMANSRVTSQANTLFPQNTHP